MLPLPSITSFRTEITRLRATALRHAATPFLAPPPAHEVGIPTTERGCVDTMRLFLQGANLNEDGAILRALRFQCFSPAERAGSDGDEKAARSILRVWQRDDYGLRIEEVPNGLTVQVSVPKLLFGRNDRQSDVDHDFLGEIAVLVTEGLLPNATHALRMRLAKYPYRGSMTGVWTLTRLDLALNLWLERPEDMTAIFGMLRWGRLGKTRSMPAVFSAEGDWDGRRVTGVTFGRAIRPDVRVVFYDKGMEQRAHGIGGDAELLPIGRVLRVEVQLRTSKEVRDQAFRFAKDRGGVLMPKPPERSPRYREDEDLDAIVVDGPQRRLVLPEAGHRIIYDYLDAILASALHGRLPSMRMKPSMRALVERGRRCLDAFDMHPENAVAVKGMGFSSSMPPERVVSDATRAMSMRLAMQRLAEGGIRIMDVAYPDGQPGGRQNRMQVTVTSWRRARAQMLIRAAG